MVAANEPVPEPVTSPVSVIVWSPVLLPEVVPEMFDPAIVPEAATDVGSILPRVSEPLDTDIPAPSVISSTAPALFATRPSKRFDALTVSPEAVMAPLAAAPRVVR